MEKKKLNKFLLIFYIISILLLIYSVYLIIDWFMDNKPILAENVTQILGVLMIDSAKFMFEGEFENE